MSVTIRDIAQIAGVSHSTVSRALNGHPSVKPETKQNIQRIACQMNYRPNTFAKGLKTSRSYMFLFLAGESASRMPASFFYEILGGILEEAGDEYFVVFKLVKQQHDLQHIFLNRKYDGVLLLCASKKDFAFFEPILTAIPNRRLVILNGDAGTTISSVFFDEEEGAYQGVMHLRSAGHQRIAFLEGPEELEATKLRRAGYQKALWENTGTDPRVCIGKGDLTIEGGIQAMRQVFSDPIRPTAVFATNDYMALGALHYCRSHNIRVPDDLSIIGFDNLEFSTYADPALSTVSKSRQMLGRTGAALLKKSLNNDSYRMPKRIVLHTELILRSSCKPINSEK